MTQRWYLTAALLGICLLPGCQQQSEPKAETRVQDAETGIQAPALPIVDPPIDRETLLLAVMRAASNAALGRTDQAQQRKLDGRRFELRLRFGCFGATDESPSRSWAYDERRRKLTVRVDPEITRESPQVRALAVAGYEAVEGFWIRRSWLLAADCPVPAVSATVPENQPAGGAPAASAEAPPQSSIPHVGIAQFFTPTDPRTHRRDDRAYAATRVLPQGVSPSPVGYDLVIVGRLRQLASGSVIACVNRSAAMPPDCMVSAQFESVTIKHPVSGETIAEWTGA